MNRYQVFFATNKNYIIPLAVTIRSLVEHANNENQYDLYVATDLSAMDPESITKIKSMAQTNVSIEFVDSKTIDPRLNPNSRDSFKHISLDTFSRFYIDQLIPADTYVLYLDVDILIKDDIAKIFQESVPAEFSISCVRVGSDHINCGMILFNVKNMVEKGYFNQLIEYAIRKKVDDETAVNLVIPNKEVNNLQNRWNCAPSSLSRLNWNPEIKSDLWSSHPNQDFARQLTAAFQNPGIIHFLGAQKPWNYRMRAMFPHQVVETFYHEWWDCYRQTPFFDPSIYQEYLDKKDYTLQDLEEKRQQLKERASNRKNIAKVIMNNDFKQLWKSLIRKIIK